MDDMSDFEKIIWDEIKLLRKEVSQIKPKVYLMMTAGAGIVSFLVTIITVVIAEKII